MTISALRPYLRASPHRARLALARIARQRTHPDPTPDEQRLALHVARLITSGEIHAARLALDHSGALVAQPEARKITTGDIPERD